MFLDEPFVTELLLRRSLLPFLLRADLDKFLLHAESTVTGTLCWTWLLPSSRGRSGEANRGVVDDEPADEYKLVECWPKLRECEMIDRLWL